MRFWVILVFIALLFACNSNPEDITVDGILEVPENRNDPNSRTLKLVYKVLKAKDTSSIKAPIVYLQGGPGAATLIMEAFWKDHPLRNDRDIVLMDQRGTGASGANCTDIGEKILSIVRQDLSYYEESRALDSVFNKCKEALDQHGVDLAGYTSKENAADFEELRKALGYKKWNLYGASYGTRLGLTIMRDFPNSVRSAILIGVFAPESQLFGELVGHFESALFEVLRRCEKDDNCNSRYPDLKDRLVKSLKKLHSEPLRFDYKGSPFILNYRDALLLLHQALYSRYSIAYVPSIIEALESGEIEHIVNALKRIEFLYNLVNWPMNNSVMAYEELPFYNSTEMDKVLEQSELGFDIATFEGVTSLANWHPYRAADFENQSVVSDIPTLMVSGILDPVTPPIEASIALKHLKNGYGVIFQDESHEMYNPCFFQIAEDFLNDPLNKPNMDCSLERHPIEWNLSSPVQ